MLFHFALRLIVWFTFCGFAPMTRHKGDQEDARADPIIV
jgi:hypothetical protein